MIGDKREYTEVFFEQTDLSSKVRCTTRVWFHLTSSHVLIEQDARGIYGDLDGKYVVELTRTIRDCHTSGEGARIGIDVHDQLCVHVAKDAAA